MESLIHTPHNWILIRGLARGQGHWGKFPQHLKKIFKKCHIYYIDLPGNGELYKTTTPLSVKNFIPSFELQLKNQNFNPEYKTYGYSLSLGSMAMAEWASHNPHLFHKIFLSNTSAACSSPFYKRLLPQAIIMGFKMSFLKDLKEKEILSLLTTTSLSRERLLQQHQEEIEGLTQYSQQKATGFKNIIYHAGVNHIKWIKRMLLRYKESYKVVKESHATEGKHCLRINFMDFLNGIDKNGEGYQHVHDVGYDDDDIKPYFIRDMYKIGGRSNKNIHIRSKKKIKYRNVKRSLCRRR